MAYRINYRIDAVQNEIRVAQSHMLRWSADSWRTAQTTTATAVGHSGFYADADPGDGEAVAFTLYWPLRGAWEGRNYAVAIEK